MLQTSVSDGRETDVFGETKIAKRPRKQNVECPSIIEFVCVVRLLSTSLKSFTAKSKNCAFHKRNVFPIFVPTTKKTNQQFKR